MRIKSLHISGLTKHENTKIELPETGLVVVRGENGSGKSTIVEAPAVCAWNKSLRGTDLWRGEGEIVMELYDGSVYTRKRSSSGRTTLKVDDDHDHQTARRAQRAVSSDFRLWQRSCVFSGEDVVSFSRAADSERKRMLESALGISRFDEALDRAKEELAQATREEREAEMRKTNTAHEVESLRAQLRSAEDMLSAVPDGDPAAIRGHVEDFEHQVRELNADSVTQDSLAGALRAKSSELGQEVRQARAQIAAEGRAECATCKRPFDEYRADEVAKLHARIKEVDAENAAVIRQGKAAVQEAKNLRAKADERVRLSSQLAAKIEELESWVLRKQVLEDRRDLLTQKLSDGEHKVSELTARWNELTEQKALLEVCVKILGLRGVRAHVLGEALVGLEHAANYWLEKFSPWVSLRVRPQKELKNGSKSDEITIALEGVAAGNGYKGSSRGERRRQDVAIMWALGEVGAAASGQAESTMFCDEPESGLDKQGVQAMVDALREVRERRCVVVISHHDEFIAELRPDKIYEVANGEVTLFCK